MKKGKRTELKIGRFLLAAVLAAAMTAVPIQPYAARETEAIAAEETAQVQGKIMTVKSEGEQVPVEGVKVCMEGSGLSLTAVSDREGEYCIEGARIGQTYRLCLEKPGFHSTEEDVIIKDRETFLENRMELSAQAELYLEKKTFFVGEIFEAGFVCEELSGEVESVEWHAETIRGESDVLKAEKDGRYQGLREGTAEIWASAHTKYGDVISSRVQIAIAAADTRTTITAIEPETGSQVKELRIQVKVTANQKEITEGRVNVSIARRFTEKDSWMPVAELEADSTDGEEGFTCVYQPEETWLNGRYQIRAEYLGIPGKYQGSSDVADSGEGYFDTPPLEILWGGELEKTGDGSLLQTQYMTEEDWEQQEAQPFLAVDAEKLNVFLQEGEEDSSEEKEEPQPVFTFSADPEQIRFFWETGEEAGEGGNAEVKGSERIYLRFSRACREGETFSLTISRADFHFHLGTQAVFQIQVNPKPVVLSTDGGSKVQYTKIYDKETVFSSYEAERNSFLEDSWEGIASIAIEGAGSGEEVAVKEIKGTQKILSVKWDEDGNPMAQKTILNLTGAVLTGAQAGNYTADLEKSKPLDAQITVLPRKIYLQVAEGQREYGHRREADPESICYEEQDPVKEWREIPGFQAQTEGILDPDDRAGIRFPIPTEKQYGISEYPDYLEGRYEKTLTVLKELEGKENGDPGDNYSFVFDPEKMAEGTLTVQKEDVASHGYRNYIDYKEESQNLYISRESMETENFGKVWAAGDSEPIHVYVSESAAAFYDQVFWKTEKGAVEISSADQGISIAETEGEISDGKSCTAEIYLRHSKSGQMSEPFWIRLYVDTQKPFVEKTSITEKTTPLEELFHWITFGKFYGKNSGKEEQIQVSDGKGSGIREWSYHIMEGNCDSDFTKSRIEDYIRPDSGLCVWQTPYIREEGRDNAVTQRTIRLPREEGSYVVLIRVKDNVGQEQVITSNGFLLDYQSPQVEIRLAEDQPEASSGIYGEDVKLMIRARETQGNASASHSGISKLQVQVKAGEKVTQQDTLVDRERETGKTAWTLEEIRQERYRAVDLPYIVECSKNNSNHVKVTATVTDQAGNQSSAEYTLMIDTTAPKAEIRYFSSVKAENKIYYRQPVQAEVVYTERNFADTGEYLWFHVVTEQGAKDYSIQELESELGIETRWEELQESVQQDNTEPEYRTDRRQHKLLLTFRREEHYQVTPYIRDLAERKTAVQPVRGDTGEFVVDCTAPEIQVRYKTQEGQEFQVFHKEEERVYQKQPVYAEVRILEHNFAGEEEAVKISLQVRADPAGNLEELPDYQALAQKNTKQVWKQEGDLHTSVYEFRADAGYCMEITYMDLAGNTAVYQPAYFTVDQTSPTGSIRVEKLGFWDHFLETVTFGLFSRSQIKAEIRGEDAVSPICPVQYACFPDSPSKAELETFTDWKTAKKDTPGFAVFSIDPDRQMVICAKVTDFAGNCTYLSTDGIIADRTPPGPRIAVTEQNRPADGIFRENPVLRIEAEDPQAGGTYSGLERVWYTVTAEGNVNTEETAELYTHTGEKGQGQKKFQTEITVPAKVFNSSQVKVQVFARDLAGNTAESEITELKIDTTPPVITVSWDKENTDGSKYYKDARTASITIQERSFDPERVRMDIAETNGAQAQIGPWSVSQEAGVLDQAAHTCQVVFTEDGDYTFSLTCTDLAGNTSVWEEPRAFTIDRTAPVIRVSYGKSPGLDSAFYREPVTAVLSIEEHNFQEQEVKIRMTASLQGEEIQAPSVSPFTHSGDVHTAVITYETDGDYTFEAEYTDPAGNAAAVYETDVFTVDLTAPSVEIWQVEDQSANQGSVAPQIRIADTNYDPERTEIVIKGEKNGILEPKSTVSSIQNGEVIRFQDFARTEEMDDLYSLSVTAADQAGNQTEKTIRFSVNRYGSVYALEPDTKQWLSTSESEYTYLKEERDVAIAEYNLDAAKHAEILVNHDGELKQLMEGKDYTVTEQKGRSLWKIRQYRILAKNFAVEGNYAVILSTEDEAGNVMTNTSMKKSGKNLPIVFAVDKTGPTAVVTGIEDKGQYREAERRIQIDVKDNLSLEEVSVSVDGKTRNYGKEELREREGIIGLSIKGASHWQEIRIQAADSAGNLLGENGENQTSRSLVLRVLVTPEVLVQYYMNKPLLFSSLIAAAAGAGSLIWYVRRKKQHTQQK